MHSSNSSLPLPATLRVSEGSAFFRLRTPEDPIRKGFPGVSMKDVPEPQIQEAVEMYESWNALKKTKRPNNDHLRTLLFRLGFGTVTLSESTAYPRAYLTMETTPAESPP